MNILRGFAGFLIILTILFDDSLTSPNCLELSSSNIFGRTKSNSSCFSHLIDSLDEMTVYYTISGINGFSFDLKNGENKSYMENYHFKNYERINLNNLYLIGVDIWLSSRGVGGLQFQVYDKITQKYNITSKFGSTNECHFYLNSTFMKSNYLKINSISGCIDDENTTDFPKIEFTYSFSQCPILNSSSSLLSCERQIDNTCIPKGINSNYLLIDYMKYLF